MIDELDKELCELENTTKEKAKQLVLWFEENNCTARQAASISACALNLIYSPTRVVRIIIDVAVTP